MSQYIKLHYFNHNMQGHYQISSIWLDVIHSLRSKWDTIHRGLEAFRGIWQLGPFFQ